MILAGFKWSRDPLDVQTDAWKSNFISVEIPFLERQIKNAIISIK